MIATTMVVSGCDAYFTFAKYSVMSFLKSCPGVPLIIFSDNVEKISSIAKSEFLFLYDFNEIFNLVPMPSIKDKPNVIVSYETYDHNHVMIASIYSMAQHVIKDIKFNNIEYIIKFDTDGYFVGNIINKLTKHIRKNTKRRDLMLVERKHKLMEVRYHKLPGVGFVCWRKKSRFVEMYEKIYNGDEQGTILTISCKSMVKSEVLKHPGYHFVYPFNPGTKRHNYTKEQLKSFLPAFFHVHKIEELEQLKKWFG